MRDTSNVVHSFPADRVVRRSSSLQDSSERFKKHRINQILDDNATILAMQLLFNGINIHDGEFEKGFSLAIEFLRAALYKTHDIDHPLQLTATEIINQLTKKPT